jgi:SAM-dependent methyltransferase
VNLRSLVPLRLRRLARTIARELPVRLNDAPADLFGERSLPPARLRFNVAGSSDRRSYSSVGAQAAEEIERALGKVAATPLTGAFLDFGCGCGRITAPLQRRCSGVSFHGVDVDARAIAWCLKNLPGDFRALSDAKRLPFADRLFDVVYAISIFTHMDEAEQFIWLDEVHRVMKPDGIFLATTHSPELAYARPDLADSERQSLQDVGFAFAPGPRFNDNSAFHSAGYLRSAWSRWFELIEHEPFGLVGYQDLSTFTLSTTTPPTRFVPASATSRRRRSGAP